LVIYKKKIYILFSILTMLGHI